MNQEKQTKTRKKLYQPPTTNEIGKLQPQAVDMENAVLGAIILEKEAYDSVAIFLKVEHFYKEQNQFIYKSVISLASKAEPIDLINICQELKRNGDLELVGGSFYVSSLTDRIASSSNIESHARIVVQKYLSREIIRISTHAIKDAYEDCTDCFDLIEKTASDISELESGVDSNECFSIEQIKEDVVAECKDVIFNGTVTGVPISINSLHKVINGWRPGMIVLAARPGMGKTAVALEFAWYPASLGKPVMFFSLEMSRKELVGRLMSKISGVSSQKINNNTVDTYELSSVIKDTVAFSGIPLYIDDTPSLSIGRLRSKAHKAKREKGIELIIIDYLQLMDGMEGDFGNREQEISKITRGIKKLSKELEIPIIALSQLSRSVENRPGFKIPQLSDLRESGSIEQDADMVMFIYRPEYYEYDTYEHNGVNISSEGLMSLQIAKFRGGKPGDVLVRWEGKTTSISNWDYSKPGDAQKAEQPQAESRTIQDNTSFLNESSLKNIVVDSGVTKSFDNNNEPFF